ncbi:hypothetical protein C8R44DRAFT_631675 [Mycena epipterygia]|nr:hypothetical protein C8R44DRAFT_631675 [Mycena epipterygia]
MASPAWHYVLKSIITGAFGKSSLVRFTDRRFFANPDPTFGVEFGSKSITLPDADGTAAKLQSAGTESFPSITRLYYWVLPVRATSFTYLVLTRYAGLPPRLRHHLPSLNRECSHLAR